MQHPLTDDEQRMVEANMALVYAVARKRTNNKLPVEDKVQAGAMGLMRAAQLFDPSLGFEFSTYAMRWIQSAIQKAEAGFQLVHVPQYVRHDHSSRHDQAKAERFHADRDRAYRIGGGVCDDDVAGCGSSEAVVDDADEIAWVIGKLDRLAARQRDVLRSMYWDGEGRKRIARRYEVRDETVRLWAIMALSHLRDIYEDEYRKGA